jgi:hypothetical protein
VPAPELAKISLQYSARIFSLRRRRGWQIANRVRIVDGKKHGEFRLGSRPVPSNAELRRGAAPSPTASKEELSRQSQARQWIAGARAEPAQAALFGERSPERHRDDG